MMNIKEIVVLRSASDAAEFGLSWNFIQDGSEYGIFDMHGETLPVHIDEEGNADGWEFSPAE